MEWQGEQGEVHPRGMVSSGSSAVCFCCVVVIFVFDLFWCSQFFAIINFRGKEKLAGVSIVSVRLSRCRWLVVGGSRLL